MTRLHLRATVANVARAHTAAYRPLLKAWHEKYSDEFLGLASDLLAQYSYGLTLWKIENDHPTIWENRFRRISPKRRLTPEQVQQGEHPKLDLRTPMIFDPWEKPVPPVQPSLGLEGYEEPLKPGPLPRRRKR
jgi:hypothetical protein